MVYTEAVAQIYEEKCKVSLFQTSKTVWCAHGDYKGTTIEVKGRTSSQALAHWIDRAKDIAFG